MATAVIGHHGDRRADNLFFSGTAVIILASVFVGETRLVGSRGNTLPVRAPVASRTPCADARPRADACFRQTGRFRPGPPLSLGTLRCRHRAALAMLIAGDIGGTKTALAIFSNPGGPHAPVAEEEFHRADYLSGDDLCGSCGVRRSERLESQRARQNERFKSSNVCCRGLAPRNRHHRVLPLNASDMGAGRRQSAAAWCCLD